MTEWDKLWENKIGLTILEEWLKDIKLKGDKLQEKAQKWDSFSNDVASNSYELAVIPEAMYQELLNISGDFENELEKRSNIGEESESERVVAEMAVMRKLREWSINYNARATDVMKMRQKLEAIERIVKHHANTNRPCYELMVAIQSVLDKEASNED